VWELRDESYVEVAHVAGDDEVAAPFPVGLTAAQLLE
jgi:hypothetical protein